MADASGTTIYGAAGFLPLGQSGRTSIDIPASNTHAQLYFSCIAHNLTVNSGQMLVFGAPQVELGGGMTTYQPSSEPPIATTTYFLRGSTSGDYSTTNNSSFANVDGTNLSKAVFVPAGWNLAIDAMGWVYAPTAGNGTNIALADGGTLINAVSATSGAAAGGVPFSFSHTIIGDNATHTISLQWQAIAAAPYSSKMGNGGQDYPVLRLHLERSNSKSMIWPRYSDNAMKPQIAEPTMLTLLRIAQTPSTA